MPKSDETASGAAPDAATRVSVFDFLYRDAARVASYLSQFDRSGLLTGIKQIDNVTEQESDEGTFQGGASILMAKAQATGTIRRGLTNTEAA